MSLATAKTQPLTTISGGINRLRTKGGATRDALFDAVNCYVTAANTVVPRPGTVRNADLSALAPAGATKGLVGYQGQLHVFSASVVAVPAGYQLHVLTHPAVSSIYSPPFPGLGLPGWTSTVPTLLNFEDGNGSTTFADTGVNPVTWTSVGGAAVTNTQAKFGTGSLSVNGNTKKIKTTIQPGDPLDLITGQPDWTIEMWVFVPTASLFISDLMALMDLSSGFNYAFRMYLQSDGAGAIKTLATQMFGNNGWQNAGASITDINGGAGMSLNAWHHIAVCRDQDLYEYLLTVLGLTELQQTSLMSLLMACLPVMPLTLRCISAERAWVLRHLSPTILTVSK